MSTPLILIENMDQHLTKYSFIGDRKVVFSAMSSEPLNAEEVETLRTDPTSMMPPEEVAA